MNLGAIDVGSNAMRLLIGDVCKENGSFKMTKLFYCRLPLRLGEDIFANGCISEIKREKLMQGLSSFLTILDFYNIKEYKAVSTSAMRDSINKKEIIETIFHSLHLKLEVISGKHEADLISQSFQLIHNTQDDFLTIDVGGGSTEITYYLNNQIQFSKSFQLGTLRQITKKEKDDTYQKLKTWLFKNIKKNSKELQVFGTGGNINRIHKILGYPNEKPISNKNLNELYEAMSPLTFEERAVNYNLKWDRVDVIIPAMEIYRFILKEINVSNIYVPKIGLSDGVLLDLHNRLNS